MDYSSVIIMFHVEQFDKGIRHDIMENMEPEEKAIADLRATGMAGTKIADELGICKSKVYNVLNKEEVKNLVEQEYNEFIKCLPAARRNVENLILQHDQLDPESKDKQRAWASSMEMLRSAGILPGNLSQLTINNIQINNQQVISPIILNLLGKVDDDIVIEQVSS